MRNRITWEAYRRVTELFAAEIAKLEKKEMEQEERLVLMPVRDRFLSKPFIPVKKDESYCLLRKMKAAAPRPAIALTAAKPGAGVGVGTVTIHLNFCTR